MILLLIYLLSGLLCLAVAAWGVITGQFFDMDGLFLVLVCLSLAAIFLGAFGLSVWKGEFAEIMSKLRPPKAAKPEPTQQAQPSKAAKETPSETAR